jgi:uncharacterized protein YndB with AHSA1/START domain
MKPPVARTQMLIRRPVNEVFRAFVDPATTTKFWFTRGSGSLVRGEGVTWFWDMYGVSADVQVVALEENERILIHWPTPVEWQFSSRGDNATFVTITASGFTGTDDEQVTSAIDSMGGFSFTLAACKAWLEHAIELNVVLDHDRDHTVQSKT